MRFADFVATFNELQEGGGVNGETCHATMLFSKPSFSGDFTFQRDGDSLDVEDRPKPILYGRVDPRRVAGVA